MRRYCNLQMKKENGMHNFDLSISERLLKAADVARIRNISKAMADRLIQRGALPVVRINHCVRVQLGDLQEFIEQSRRPAAKPLSGI